jgi:transcription initiation factor IIE alpha subunit
MSTDKFGDKLRDKEKAEEDRYFAEQDRAKLEQLRKRAARESAPTGVCPRCGEMLVETEIRDVTVDTCQSCHGVWLDAGELEALSSRLEEGWFSHWVRTVLGA